MKQAVAVGYASLDYPMTLDGYFRGDHTVMVSQRPSDTFPRPGGSPLYVARSLAKAGVDTAVITWIGADSLGQLFCCYVTDDGINDDGIAVVTPGSTPVCFLLYQQDGSCGCCFDPGFMGREELTAKQQALIRNADLVCITVGPADIGIQALALARDDAIIAWVAKNDPLSFSEPLRAQLGQRADYIFCNAQERTWIDNALQCRSKAPPFIVETRGTGSVCVMRGDDLSVLPVKPLQVNDTSGAGDTFSGACLAAIMKGETALDVIARAGIEASYNLLSQRKIVY